MAELVECVWFEIRRNSTVSVGSNPTLSYFDKLEIKMLKKNYCLYLKNKLWLYKKRVTRFERATSTLARLRSTTELHPHICLINHTKKYNYLSSLVRKTSVRFDILTKLISNLTGHLFNSYITNELNAAITITRPNHSPAAL